MSKVRIGRPSAGLIVGVVALVVALGGSAVAVTALNKREKQQVRKIANRLDKGVSDSASRKVKSLRKEITSPRSAGIPLPGLDEPECGTTEGWYGYNHASTGNDQRLRTFADIGGPVWFSGGALYCGGSKVAFTVPKPSGPADTREDSRSSLPTARPRTRQLPRSRRRRE